MEWRRRGGGGGGILSCFPDPWITLRCPTKLEMSQKEVERSRSVNGRDRSFYGFLGIKAKVCGRFLMWKRLGRETVKEFHETSVVSGRYAWVRLECTYRDEQPLTLLSSLVISYGEPQ